ncbi:MAG TPA: ABC-F type ribosomal protection protein [Symbiobacteriaceae bacterium]|nr:ABC-F type ribosomal protection protein [Symbiobacteriaceae bacterium]
MIVLQAYDVTKEYQGHPVLTGCTFHLAGSERVGLVGANGCGKSTLLKILAGALPADGGSLRWVTPGLSRVYLVQEGHWEPGRPLEDQLGAVPADLLARCGIDRAALAQPAGTLSGGQKTRAALARALAARPDVLLLDEPTNHLDAGGLSWLESVLATYPGTILVVSHDRYFLDQVTTRILELDGGKLKDYPGNYSAYARQKQMELERAHEEYRQYVKEKARLLAAIRRERQWADRSHRSKQDGTAPKNWKDFQRSQAKAHMQVARSMENRLERIKVDKPRDAQHLHMRIDGQGAVGRNLILAENLGFTFSRHRPLFQGASFYVQRGDRVAIIGPNGSGKTTLIRLILGELAPTEGRLYTAPLRAAYLAQELDHLHPENTVLQEATGNAALDQAAARTLLGCLLFSGEAIFKKVAMLSGGEKVRLALAKILLSAPDMLVLDEPTNGLDLPSRERVEEALESYGGTLLLVSHDRYLLSRIATRVIHIKDGRLEPFGGSYQEFLARGRGQDRTSQILLLENRLAQLSAALTAPSAEEKERLTAEFIQVSRELRVLRG